MLGEGATAPHNSTSSNILTAQPRHSTGRAVCCSHSWSDQNPSYACAWTDSMICPNPQVREQLQHTIAHRATARQPNPLERKHVTSHQSTVFGTCTCTPVPPGTAVQKGPRSQRVSAHTSLSCGILWHRPHQDSTAEISR